MIGRVYRVDAIGEGARGRTSFEFDALDERVLDGVELRQLYLSARLKPFGLVRIMTTTARFKEVFGSVPTEGSWYRLELTPQDVALKRAAGERLLSWHAQLTARGYTTRSRGYVTGADFLSRDGEPPLRPLSAMTAAATAARQTAIAAAQFPNFAKPKNRAVQAMLSRLPAIQSIEVHDVGQASFATLYDAKDEPVLHFDAGWPVGFNEETIPPKAPKPGDAPVVLSHWDWDHLGGYYRFPTLQAVPWIVPVQYLGYGAGRVAARLDAAGLLRTYTGLPFAGGSLRLGLCGGTAGDKNQTGLAMRVDLPPAPGSTASTSRGVLLPGDGDYDHIPALLTTPALHGLVVTHHGALFNGGVPLAPASGGLAIVSVGKGNHYKHPKAAALKRHSSRGWSKIRMTQKKSGVSRGSKWFT